MPIAHTETPRYLYSFPFFETRYRVSAHYKRDVRSMLNKNQSHLFTVIDWIRNKWFEFLVNIRLNESNQRQMFSIKSKKKIEEQKKKTRRKIDSFERRKKKRSAINRIWLRSEKTLCLTLALSRFNERRRRVAPRGNRITFRVAVEKKGPVDNNGIASPHQMITFSTISAEQTNQMRRNKTEQSTANAQKTKRSRRWLLLFVDEKNSFNNFSE